jgi:hypothetical protein
VMVFMSYRMYYDGSPVVKGGLFSKPIRPPGHLRCASYATPVASVGMAQILPRKARDDSRTPPRSKAAQIPSCPDVHEPRIPRMNTNSALPRGFVAAVYDCRIGVPPRRS